MPDSSENTAAEPILPSYLKISMIVLTSLTMVGGTFAAIYALHALVTVIAPTLLITLFFVVPLAMLVLLGSILPIFALIGCYAALKGIHHYLKMCSLVMCLCLFMSVMIASFTGTVYLTVTGLGTRLPLEQAIITYHLDLQIAGQIDSIQENLQCCGINGKKDWNNNARFLCDTLNLSYQKCNVPPSCCDMEKNVTSSSECGFDALNVTNQISLNKTSVYEKGCLYELDGIITTIALDLALIYTYMISLEIFVWKISSLILILHKDLDLQGGNNQLQPSDIAHGYI